MHVTPEPNPDSGMEIEDMEAGRLPRDFVRRYEAPAQSHDLPKKPPPEDECD
ncbi:MAG TPA: hypothetical protein VGB97_04235 [Candidatus Paceibacterota bacterium]